MKAYYITHDPYEEDFSYILVVNGNTHMRIGAFDDHVDGVALCLEAFGYEEKWVDEMKENHEASWPTPKEHEIVECISKMEMEQSYLDLLNKLKTDVRADIIPMEEKAEILQSIYRLEVLLWKYSA